jgi:hypothetical protein
MMMMMMQMTMKQINQKLESQLDSVDSLSCTKRKEEEEEVKENAKAS